MNYPAESHWLDLPVDPDSEYEEETPARKPLCTFTKHQTLLVFFEGGPKEFPVGGDELHLGQTFRAYGGLIQGEVFGYVLQRNPDFAHKFYGWALER